MKVLLSLLGGAHAFGNYYPSRQLLRTGGNNAAVTLFHDGLAEGDTVHLVSDVAECVSGVSSHSSVLVASASNPGLVAQFQLDTANPGDYLPCHEKQDGSFTALETDNPLQIAQTRLELDWTAASGTTTINVASTADLANTVDSSFVVDQIPFVFIPNDGQHACTDSDVFHTGSSYVRASMSARKLRNVDFSQAQPVQYIVCAQNPTTGVVTANFNSNLATPLLFDLLSPGAASPNVGFEDATVTVTFSGVDFKEGDFVSLVPGACAESSISSGPAVPPQAPLDASLSASYRLVSTSGVGVNGLPLTACKRDVVSMLVYSAAGATFTIYPEVPPTWPTDTGLKDADVVQGSNHTLVCKGESRPPPSYQWTFQADGATSEQTLCSAETTPCEADGMLDLTQLTSADTGSYACYLWNGAVPSTPRSHSAVVRVLDEAAPSITAAPQDVTEPSSSSVVVSLSCSATGRPNPSVEWLTQSAGVWQALDQGLWSVQSSSIPIPGSLYDRTVSSTVSANLPEGTDEAIRCRAANDVTDDTADARVRVVTPEKPDWVSLPSTLHVVSGVMSQIVLVVAATVPPTRSVVWLEDGSLVPQDGTNVWHATNNWVVSLFSSGEVLSSKLTLPARQAADGKQYSYTARLCPTEVAGSDCTVSDPVIATYSSPSLYTTDNTLAVGGYGPIWLEGQGFSPDAAENIVSLAYCDSTPNARVEADGVEVVADANTQRLKVELQSPITDQGCAGSILQAYVTVSGTAVSEVATVGTLVLGGQAQAESQQLRLNSNSAYVSMNMRQNLGFDPAEMFASNEILSCDHLANVSLSAGAVQRLDLSFDPVQSSAVAQVLDVHCQIRTYGRVQCFTVGELCVCSNRGSCPTQAGDNAVCTCQTGWTGPVCDIDCAANPQLTECATVPTQPPACTGADCPCVGDGCYIYSASTMVESRWTAVAAVLLAALCL